MTYTIVAFYCFVSLSDPDTLRDRIAASFTEDDLCGTLLIAHEGVNGTLAGSIANVDRLLDFLVAYVGLDRAEVKFSRSEERPFGRLKFQLKKEIIAFRKAQVDPCLSGRYVEPKDWNRLISDPEVLIVDTRNRYETELGTFAGAMTPEIDTFSDFATFVRDHLDPAKHRKIAMFCTGGIRCEKASAFMLQEGFNEIYHLKGGVLRYLEEVPAESSTWRGKCFVFDRRTSVGHDDYRDRDSASKPRAIPVDPSQELLLVQLNDLDGAEQA